MRHNAHFRAYELLASRLSSSLDVSQCDKKRSNTLLTISGATHIIPASFVLSQISPLWLSPCHVDTYNNWSRDRSHREQHFTWSATLSLKLWCLNYNSHVMHLISPSTIDVILVSVLSNVPLSSWSPFSELNIMQLILRSSPKVLNRHGSYLVPRCCMYITFLSLEARRFNKGELTLWRFIDIFCALRLREPYHASPCSISLYKFNSWIFDVSQVFH